MAFTFKAGVGRTTSIRPRYSHGRQNGKLVNEYNKKVSEEYATKRLCNAELQKPALLTLNRPPISACSPAAAPQSTGRTECAAAMLATVTYMGRQRSWRLRSNCA